MDSITCLSTCLSTYLSVTVGSDLHIYCYRPDQDVGLLVFHSLPTFNQRVVYLVVWSLPKAVGSVVFEVTLWSAWVLCLALYPGKYECLVLALLVACRFLYLPLLCNFFQKVLIQLSLFLFVFHSHCFYRFFNKSLIGFNIRNSFCKWII